MNKKLISVMIGAMTIVSLVPTAFAQSNADLQAQIAALLSQIQTLQGQLGSGSTAPSSFSFSRDLTVGSSGADVKALQQFLNSHGAMVSGSGAGSPGNESSYFGGLTKAALAQYQATNNILPSLGYFGPKTRAFLAASAGVTPPPPVTGGGTGGGVVAPTSGLAVALAADNGNGGSLVNGSGRNPVMAITLTAGSSGAVNVNQLMFHKVGVVSDSSISGAYLVQSGKVVAQYVSLSNGTITFSNLGWTIPAGQSQEYWLSVDVSGGSAGNTVAFNMTSAADVSATNASNAAVAASGSFPINGGNFTVSTVSNPSLAGLTITSSTVGGTVFAGTQGVLVSQWTGNVTSNAVWLKSLKFRVTGSAAKSDLQNVKLYVNGAQVGSTLSSVSANGDAYFDLSSAPAKLNTGNSNIQVYSDVMGSPSYDFRFQLLNSYDIYAVDSQYNTSLTVTVKGGSGSLVSIQQGQLTVSLSSDTPTGNVAKGQSGVTVAKFKIYAAGEAVKLKFLDFKLTFATTAAAGAVPAPMNAVATYVRNISLQDDQGGQVGSTINTPGGTANACDNGTTGALNTAPIVYNDCFGTSASPINYIIPANTTRVLSLKVDIQNTAVFTAITGALSGQASANLQGLTSSGTATSGGAAGSALSLASSALTASLNAAIGTQTYTGNSSQVKIGSYALTASSAEGVSISNVTVQSAGNANTNYQNMTVKAGGQPFGQTYSTLAATTTYTFSGTPFSVAAGQTVYVDVYADVLSGAASSAAAGDLASTLSGCSGTGLISFSSISCNSVIGQAVKINTTGPTLTVGADAATAPAGQLIMGSSGNSLASFRFTETSNVEDVKITDLVVFQRHQSQTKSDFGNLTLWDGQTPVGSANSAVLSANLTGSSTGIGYNYQFHFANPITVTKSGSKTLVLKGDVATFNSGAAGDNTTSTFEIATSTEFNSSSTVITSKGAYSNTQAFNVLSSPTGNTMTVLRTNLTVAVAPLGLSSNRAKSPVDDIATITFSAPAAGGASLSSTTLTISGTLATSTFNDGDISLVNTSNVAVGIVASTTPCSAGSCVFQWTGFGANGIVSAGNSLVLKLRINSSAHTAVAGGNTSESFAVTFQAANSVNYNDTTDSSGNFVNLPGTVVPLVVSSVSYAPGT